MPNSSRSRGIIAMAAGAIVAASIAFTATPASAGASGYSNGAVGVQQSIVVSGACANAFLSFQGQYSNGTQTTSSGTFATDSSGNGTVLWTPPSPGSVQGQIVTSGTSFVCPPMNLGSVQISQVATQTTVNAPNTAQVGVATKVTVTVQSQSPSTNTPTGTVTVKDGQGNVVQNMGLTSGPGTGQSYAYWWFTAPSTGSYVFQATYNGDTNSGVSTSPQDIMFASPSGNTITLTAPGTLTVGVPVTLTATLVPANIQGSVGFTFNGQPISASVPIQNGVATFTWTPTTPGAATLGANYTTNGGATGSTTDPVTIVAGPIQSDVITLTQPGVGTWAPNGTYGLPGGTSTTMTANTLSGSTVTLTETGPCTVNGLTITVPPSGGQCNIQAKSNGGNGYAPVTYGYTVNAGVAQQTANISAPLSGKVNKGRTLVLESPGQSDTNAGQNINWTITQGKGKVCKLVYPNDGAVNLKMTGKGKCTVKGSAPGIPNQWAPYQVLRTYRT